MCHQWWRRGGRGGGAWDIKSEALPLPVSIYVYSIFFSFLFVRSEVKTFFACRIPVVMVVKTIVSWEGKTFSPMSPFCLPPLTYEVLPLACPSLPKSCCSHCMHCVSFYIFAIMNVLFVPLYQPFTPSSPLHPCTPPPLPSGPEADISE